MKMVQYYPCKNARRGLEVWVEMFHELISIKELIWRLFIRNLKGKYKQSLLGVTWAVIMPFVVIGSFVFLRSAGVMDLGETPVPYPLYALVGLTFWQIFATSMVVLTNSMVSSGNVISKINFPKKAIVIASLAEVIFEFVIKIILVVIAFLIYQESISWYIVFLPIAIIPLFLFSLALGYQLALLNAIIRDVANIVTIGTTFLLFLVPVLYVPKKTGLIGLINEINPLSNFVCFLRNLVFGGELLIENYLITSVISILIFLISWRVFHIIEPKIAEKV